MSELLICCECGRDITDEPKGWHYKQKDPDGNLCTDCLERLVCADRDLPVEIYDMMDALPIAGREGVTK